MVPAPQVRPRWDWHFDENNCRSAAPQPESLNEFLQQKRQNTIDRINLCYKCLQDVEVSAVPLAR